MANVFAKMSREKDDPYRFIQIASSGMKDRRPLRIEHLRSWLRPPWINRALHKVRSVVEPSQARYQLECQALQRFRGAKAGQWANRSREIGQRVCNLLHLGFSGGKDHAR